MDPATLRRRGRPSPPYMPLPSRLLPFLKAKSCDTSSQRSASQDPSSVVCILRTVGLVQQMSAQPVSRHGPER